MLRHLTRICLVSAVALAAPVVARAAEAAPAAGTTPAAAASAAIRGKIGYVDMERLFQNYYKTFRDDAAFKKQKELFMQAVADQGTKLELLKKLVKEARERSVSIALSDEARAQARRDADDQERELAAKDRELRDFVREKNDQLGVKYMELRDTIVKELSAFVSDFGTRTQHELILDVSGLTRNAIPAVVYFDKSKDVTEAILTDLNKGHEAEVTKALAEDKKGKAAAAAKNQAAQP